MHNVYFDWFDKVKRYTSFNKKETVGSLLTVLVIAFAISFRQWGSGDQADVQIGLVNFLGAIIIVAVSFFGRTIFQKITALGADYRADYKLWSVGLILTLILAFLTSGKLWFLMPGGVVVHYMRGNRLGWVRYGLNHFGIGTIAIAGPIANIILAMLFRTLSVLFPGIALFHTAFLLNIIWALWQLVPIPPSDGTRMFMGSRMVYMWCVAVVASSAALLYSSFPVWLTILLSFVVAWIWWLIYYLVWERFNWRTMF